mgnify:FL=1|tara:strand:+ start:98 stop:1816 length:1719 start_codon:yes stop_codon:yes gene_type:complete
MSANSQLSDIVHSEVDAARIDLNNQSSHIRDRMMELRARMDVLERKQTPQKDGLAFESAMAITASSDVDVRGALQWHLAEVSRNNFNGNKEGIDGNNMLTRLDLEQQINDNLAKINLTERRLEELQSTTEAEHDVIVNDVNDLITLVETSPLAATPEKGPGMYVPLTDLKSVAGLRPRSRDHVEKLRIQLGQIHQMFLIKTASMVSENIDLSKENEALQREVQALRASMSRPVVVSNAQQQPQLVSQQTTSPSNHSFTPQLASFSNASKEDDPLLTFAMDNIMRVMILARIPPMSANMIYEQMLEFSKDWTEDQFLAACETSDSFVAAIEQSGIYRPTEAVKDTMHRDTFFTQFQRQRVHNATTLDSKKEEKKEKEETKMKGNNATNPLFNHSTQPKSNPAPNPPPTTTTTTQSSSPPPPPPMSTQAAAAEQEAKRAAYTKNVVNTDSPKNSSNSSDSKGRVPSEKSLRRKSKRDKKGKRRKSRSSAENIAALKASVSSHSLPISEALSVKNVAKNMSEVKLGSLVKIKMSNWKNAHQGTVSKMWENGSIDVTLSNGKVADSLGSSAFYWGK